MERIESGITGFLKKYMKMSTLDQKLRTGIQRCIHRENIDI